MKEKSEKQDVPAKVFPFRFSASLLTVFGVLLVLCAACFALTTWQFTGFLRGDISSPYDWLKYILLYLVSVLLAVLITAMLIRSRYIVTEHELIVQFGLIRSKYELKKIFSVRLFKSTGKLAVYFDDFKTKYMVIVVNEKWYDEFIRTLLIRNERIEVDFSPEDDGKPKTS